VRKGAAKPDISSADAFKRSMLAARSIAYPDPTGGGASGIYVASLLERLGIAMEMKPKTKLFPPTEVLYASVASGEVEIGFNQISEILAQPTVELAGPLPSHIDLYVAAFDPAKFAEPRHKGGEPHVGSRRRASAEETNGGEVRHLLRARRDGRQN
jgi:ABC-type molybdate transport system substrate-binding protein